MTLCRTAFCLAVYYMNLLRRVIVCLNIAAISGVARICHAPLLLCQWLPLSIFCTSRAFKVQYYVYVLLGGQGRQAACTSSAAKFLKMYFLVT